MGTLNKYLNSAAVEEALDKGVAAYNQSEENKTDISLVKENALMKNQGAENVGKILVVGTDGNLVLTDMPEGGTSGDVTGVLDESNNILLSGNLADGTYTLKYENEDGTYTEIGNLVVGTIEEPEPEPTNLFVIGGDGYLADGRCSSKGADRTDTNGDCMVTNYIDIANGDTVYIKNFKIASTGGMYSGLKYSDGTTTGFFPSSSDLVTNYSKSNGITQFTINSENADYIRISGLPTLTVNDVVVTVNESLS